MGVCNFGARLVSSFTYPVSSLDEPYPMIMFTAFCGFTTVASFFLRTADDPATSDEKEQDKEQEQKK